MFPIALDLTRIPILLVGQGELLQRRQAQLADYGATQLSIITLPLEGGGKGGGQSSLQEDPLLTPPPSRGRKDLEAEIKKAAVVMAAGLPRAEAESIVNLCRAAAKLVNVEDITDLCDFYFTANVRRGDLVIAVSTSGASPTLARKIRDRIAALFGEEWTGRLKEIAQLRKLWKQEGRDMKAVVEGTEQLVRDKGWLKDVA